MKVNFPANSQSFPAKEHKYNFSIEIIMINYCIWMFSVINLRMNNNLIISQWCQKWKLISLPIHKVSLQKNTNTTSVLKS